jgi:hypothetical protein
MPIACLLECRLMAFYQLLNSSQLLGREALVPREVNRLQPKLGRQIVSIDMNVRRLIRFVTVEIEAVWAASQDGWHGTATHSIAISSSPNWGPVSIAG